MPKMDQNEGRKSDRAALVLSLVELQCLNAKCKEATVLVYSGIARPQQKCCLRGEVSTLREQWTISGSQEKSDQQGDAGPSVNMKW